jgi:diguanylate cyclase (GGDEF)-like protein
MRGNPTRDRARTRRGSGTAIRASREVAWLVSSLRRISDLLTSETPLVAVLERLLDEVIELVHADAGSVMLHDVDSGELIYQAWRGLGEEEVRRIRFRVGEGVAGWVVQHGKIARVNEPERDPRFVASVHQGMPIRALMCAPLLGPEGVVGVVNVHHASARTFEQVDEDILSVIAAQASLEIIRHRLQELAETDPLTGLRNRRYLDAQLAKEISRARRTGVPLSLAMLDLDGLKEINDREGHEAGDRLLRRVARVLRGAMRGCDHAARYGGDEFVAIFPETGRMDAVAVARRICAAVGELIGVSAGVASLEDGDDAAGLLRRADAALYRAKSEGGGTVCF